MRTINEVLEDVGKARDINDAAALLRLAVELDELHTPTAEAQALKQRGTAAHLHGDYDAAEALLTEALILFREMGDGIEVARVLAAQGGVSISRGDIPVARERLHVSLMQSRDNGDRRLERFITSALGQVALNIGDISSALEHYYESLSISEEIDDQNSVAGATCNIGLALSMIDDYASALEHFHRALQLSIELGNQRWSANALLNIGNVFNSTKDYSTALEYYERALAIYEETGNKSGTAVITTAIGWTHQCRGDLDTALACHYRAMEQHQEIGEIHAVANDLCNVVLVLLEQGLVEDARPHLRTLDSIHIDDPTLRIWREQCRAEIQGADGDSDGATTTLRGALQEAMNYGLRSKAADVHKTLRDLAQRKGDLAGYIEHNDAFVRITEEINGKDTAVKMATQAAERRIAMERQEHQKQLAILHSALPRHIADRVSRGEHVNDHHDAVTVIFLDVVDFTAISDELTSAQVVAFLHDLFTALDSVCKQHDVVKIKTIGDSYMAVAFPFDAASNADLSQSAEQRAACCALDMLSAVQTVHLPNTMTGSSALRVRIGMHCGPLTAGVIGTQRLQYDVWGDTVNVASRMESSGEAGRIHISEALAIQLKANTESTANTEYIIQNAIKESTNHESHELPLVTRNSSLVTPLVTRHLSLVTTLRGMIDVKGKGPMRTYWLERAGS